MKEDKSMKKSKDGTDMQIKELETKIVSLENSWKRAVADYKNLEKRTAEEKTNYMHFTKSQVIKEFLPFFDNLERLEDHTNDEGLKLVIKDLKNTLKNMGVEEVDALGKDFDHNTMEAMELKKGEKNKVLEIYQKGYLLNGNLLRPAKVVVGQE
jgi:molecular chaperone GrpE